MAAARWAGMPAALAAVGVLLLLHVSVGAKDLPIAVVIDALVVPDPTDFDHTIVRDLRLPRALIAASVGAALAVAGALMQGISRNPLAEPGLVGVNAGASFAVVLAVVLFDGAGGIHLLPWIAAAGALAAAFTVYVVAAVIGGGGAPLTLILAGVAVTAFLDSIISAIHLLDQDSFQQLRVWLAGSLAGRDIGLLVATAPYLAIGLAASMALGRQITALSMGEDVARSLGVQPARLRTAALACIVALSASAVTIVGPIAFVGLVVPHAVRLFVGVDYRWIVPYSAITGAGFLVAADIVARLLLRPQELATGIVTALVGAPVFIQLVRRRTA